MSYLLYADAGAGSAIIELVLSELGLEYALEGVSLATEHQRGPGYATVNPQRKLPTLTTPQGETLTESLAIALTLDARHQGAHLLPDRTSPQYAQALRWLAFTASEIYPIVEISDFPERFTAPSGDPSGTREVARQRWRERLQILEAHIAGPYLLGEHCCLVDFYIAVVTRWAQQDDWRAQHTPKIDTLAHAVAKRPACVEVWQRNFAR